MVNVDSLTGPARDCLVPRELRSDLWPQYRAEKPLWPLDEAHDAIGALEDAGAAVVQGEILAVDADGQVTALPWEPLPPPSEDEEYQPSTRRWRWEREADEPWREYVTRSAAHARRRVRALAGDARSAPAGAIHVDLAWATGDELALYDQPGWVRAWRRRVVEQGGGGQAWWRCPSVRMHRVGETAPGSYFGTIAEDLRQIPADARYAMLTLDGREPARIEALEQLETLWVSGCTDRTLSHVGRLARLREMCFMDDPALSSLGPMAGLRELEFALLGGDERMTDVAPLREMPRLRFLRLHAPGLSGLSGIGQLTQLNSLHLIPAPEVHSLAPLRGLTGLRHLGLFMAAVREGGLAPLERMPWLRSLNLDTDAFSLKEMARLAAALPHTDGPHRAPFLPPDHPIRPEPCPRCGRDDTFVTVGKPQRRMCPDCGARKLRRHVIRWEILLSAAAARNPSSPQ